MGVIVSMGHDVLHSSSIPTGALLGWLLEGGLFGRKDSENPKHAVVVSNKSFKGGMK
jgi:hypothetical protein